MYADAEIYVLLNTLLDVLLYVGACVARIICAPLHEGTQIPILPSTGVLYFCNRIKVTIWNFTYHNAYHNV